MKSSTFTFIVIFILLPSCSDEQLINPIYEKSAKLKRKIYYTYLESTQPLAIDEYEYNNRGNLIKFAHYGSNYKILNYYELFEYSSDYQLSRKINYHSNVNSPTGFILMDSTLFYYKTGKLILEKIYYPFANYTESYEYEYIKNHLIKKSKYHNQELESFIIYEYSDDINIKETYFSKDQNKYQCIIHSYKNTLCIKSEYYNSFDDLFRIILYTYDNNNNLVLTEYKELKPYSSMLDFVIRYEYF